jgi:hypothetical protein
VPGFGASVPASIGTPASNNTRTTRRGIAGSNLGRRAPSGKPVFKLWISTGRSHSASFGSPASCAPPFVPARLSITVSVGITNAPRLFTSCAKSGEGSASANK